jgi:hypothetical protein
MRNKLFKLCGITVLIFTLVANLQYALSDYGFGDKNYGLQLMAQTSTSGEIVDVAEESTSTSEGEAPPPAECYIFKLNFCQDLSMYVECEFTGRYGSPTTCSPTGCSILETLLKKTRRCVKRV